MHTQIRILGALAVVGLVAPAFTHVSAQATTAWTLMSTTAPQRTGHAMVFMPSRGVTILFGGVDATGADSQQTWEWNGTFWFLRGTGGPPARRNHAMCFNPVRNTIVLFGGFSATTGTLNDTWEFRRS